LLEALAVPEEQALAAVAATTRDRCRSPMQWSGAPNSGFCPPEVQPWLPVHPNHAAGVTVADQASDPASLLSFYRQMLALRRSTPALLAGDYQTVGVPSEEVLAFLRHDMDSGQACLVALNFSEATQRVPLEPGSRRPQLRFASPADDGVLGTANALTLPPFAVAIVDLV
jgi:alpha-glucosidase